MIGLALYFELEQSLKHEFSDSSLHFPVEKLDLEYKYSE
ncbi:hypothetical protein SAMN04488577_0181 [Bacillus sp. cl95]|nr:hypothetical protein SAMN02799634_11517 [Bacillus sp. UNCCL13]SFQ91821.1 hypothetical protein SAMN04488577_0181 [Bacillus sp. cl95]